MWKAYGVVAIKERRPTALSLAGGEGLCCSAWGLQGWMLPCRELSGAVWGREVKIPWDRQRWVGDGRGGHTAALEGDIRNRQGWSWQQSGCSLVILVSKPAARSHGSPGQLQPLSFSSYFPCCRLQLPQGWQGRSGLALAGLFCAPD